MSASDKETVSRSVERAPAETPLHRRLEKILQVARKITAPIQPWDFDEPPVRRWWDVYAR